VIKIFVVLLVLFIAGDCFSANVYLGRYVWVEPEDTNPGFWDIPAMGAGVRGNALDLRNLTGKSTENGIPGYALFSYNVPVTHASLEVDLGSEDSIMTLVQSAALEAVTGVPAGALSGMTVVDAAFELFTTHSDPLGVERPTLMPGADGNLRLSFADRKVSRRLDILDGSESSEKVKTRIQETYRKIRMRHLARDERNPEREQYKRYLDAKAKKLGVDYKELIPADLPDEGTLPHRTTFADEFVYSDGDLYSVSGGNWIKKDNDASIQSEQLISQDDSTVVGFWSTETDDDDVWAIIEFIAFAFNKSQGVTIRIDPDTGNDDNFYFLSATTVSGDDTINIRKNVSNTVSTIAGVSCSCGDVASGDTGYLEVDGSDFSLEIDDVEEVTGSDTDHVGFNTVGFYISDNSPQQILDNWEGGDLGAVVVAVPWQTRVGRRGQMGIGR
jgi:hypothetical protein